MDATHSDTHAVLFATKHLVASAVSVAGFVVLYVIVDLSLVAYAVLTGWPLGGPLQFPFWLLVALGVSLSYTALVLFPVTAAAEWLCRKRRWPILAEIPTASLMLLAYLQAISAAILLAGRGTFAGNSVAALWVALGLACPLGAYWWTLQATNGVLTLVGKVAKRFIRR